MSWLAQAKSEQKHNHTKASMHVSKNAERKVGDTMRDICAGVFVCVRASAMAGSVLETGFWFPAYPADWDEWV